jgi:hypothetical protein
MDVAADKPNGKAAMSVVLAPQVLTKLQPTMAMVSVNKTALATNEVAEMGAVSDLWARQVVAFDY